jgi:hypothetical protein
MVLICVMKANMHGHYVRCTHNGTILTILVAPHPTRQKNYLIHFDGSSVHH